MSQAAPDKQAQNAGGYGRIVAKLNIRTSSTMSRTEHSAATSKRCCGALHLTKA
jgi:hypothetical protein